MSARLDGKTALVTGAGRGIGAATARAFAAEGATLVLNDIDPGILETVTAECRLTGVPVLTCVADVSVRQEVERIFGEIEAFSADLHVLVNNAGIGGVGRTLLESDIDEWNRMIAVDLTSVFLCCKAAVPLMRSTGRGSIINLSSITGLAGTAGSVPYAAAKAGGARIDQGACQRGRRLEDQRKRHRAGPD